MTQIRKWVTALIVGIPVIVGSSATADARPFHFGLGRVGRIYFGGRDRYYGHGFGFGYGVRRYGYGYGGYDYREDPGSYPYSSSYRGPIITDDDPSTFPGIEQLARDLAREVNLLCLEMHFNYGQNSGFQEAYRDAYAMLQTAKQLPGELDQNDPDTVRMSVRGFDSLFRKVNLQVAGWTRQPQRQYGVGGLGTKLDIVGSILDDLMQSVGVERQAMQGDRAPAATEAAPQPADVPVPNEGP